MLCTTYIQSTQYWFLSEHLDFCSDQQGQQHQRRPPCEASLGLPVIWQRLSAHFAQLCSVYNLHILHSLLEDTWQIHCAHHADYGCFFCTFLHGLRICSSVQRWVASARHPRTLWPTLATARNTWQNIATGETSKSIFISLTTSISLDFITRLLLS